jgi:hypothetical protein
VTVDSLEFGFSANCMSIKIPKENIEELESIVVNPLCDWGGYGIRKQLPAWDTGYMTRKGPAVRVQFRDSRTNKTLNHTFCCDDPEQVIALLTRQR